MAILATDNFNRANGALGANWTNQTGNFANPQIVSNQVEGGATNSGFQIAFYTAISWPNDQYSQAKIIAATAGSKGFTGVTARGSTSAQTNYEADLPGGGFGASVPVEMNKVVGGTFTQLTTANVTFNANDILRITCQQTTIKTFNITTKTQLLSSTDSSITSGSAGITVDPDFGSALTDSIVDDWEGGNFVVIFKTLLGVGNL